MSKTTCTKLVTVWDVTVDLNLMVTNEIFGTLADITYNFEALVQHPPYQAIRHNLFSLQSTARWDIHV